MHLLTTFLWKIAEMMKHNLNQNLRNTPYARAGDMRRVCCLRYPRTPEKPSNPDTKKNVFLFVCKMWFVPFDCLKSSFVTEKYLKLKFYFPRTENEILISLHFKYFVCCKRTKKLKPCNLTQSCLTNLSSPSIMIHWRKTSIAARNCTRNVWQLILTFLWLDFLSQNVFFFTWLHDLASVFQPSAAAG